jgi:hypothetical protein
MTTFGKEVLGLSPFLYMISSTLPIDLQVLCTTGANLISGVTIHSFLKKPINTKSKEMTSHDGSKSEV